MDPREVVAAPAAVLALAERVCPSLNGVASFRLAAGLEAIDAGLELDGLAGLESLSTALEQISRARVEHWERQLIEQDARLVTVLDDEYPTNLRMVHDHPPFLFVRGSFKPADERAIALVGTRKPSDEGRRAAWQIAGALAERAITVVSGMAAASTPQHMRGRSMLAVGRSPSSGPGSTGSIRLRTGRWP